LLSPPSSLSCSFSPPSSLLSSCFSVILHVWPLDLNHSPGLCGTPWTHSPTQSSPVCASRNVPLPWKLPNAKLPVYLQPQ
jgi:hypothetical protein